MYNPRLYISDKNCSPKIVCAQDDRVAVVKVHDGYLEDDQFMRGVGYAVKYCNDLLIRLEMDRAAEVLGISNEQ